MNSLLDALLSSKQAVFDTVAPRLLAQGRSALTVDWSGNVNCVYRNASGQRCAVGLLMSEEELKKAAGLGMMGSGVHNLVRELGYGQHTSYDYTQFLAQLQTVHDTQDGKIGDEWRDAIIEGLRRVATNEELNTNVLDNAV